MYPLFGKPSRAMRNALLPNAENSDGRFEQQLIGKLIIASHLPFWREMCVFLFVEMRFVFFSA